MILYKLITYENYMKLIGFILKKVVEQFFNGRIVSLIETKQAKH